MKHNTPHFVYPLLVWILALLMPCKIFALSFTFGKPEGFSKLAEKTSPAVVNIYTTQDVTASPFPAGRVNPFFDQSLQDHFKNKVAENTPQKKDNSLGSGVIISKDGRIMTNHHVIAGADDIYINLSDGKKSKAKVLGFDEKLDIAILQLTRPDSYPSADLGDSDKSRIGDWVMAIGNPFGFGQTVTVGIISAKGRVLGGPYDNYIQTDASINPGNSGGPLFNMDGEVIGINTALVNSGQGIGFALPINTARGVLDQLVQTGGVKRGWLGVSVRDLGEEEITKIGDKDFNGVFVLDVVPNGPAERAGIKQGDIITKLNGGTIVNKQTLPNLVAHFLPGTEVLLTVLRADSPVDIKVALGDLDNPNKAYIYPIGDEDNQTDRAMIGIDVRDLETGDHKEMTAGVFITKVHDGSVASQIGLKRGDIIVTLADEKTDVVKDFKKRLKKIQQGGVIKLQVVRENKTLYFVFKKQ
ncbi:MAG: Do family serine endopeptidase [Deltaproteobacteria bacterium]|nr:Do family serine endopeptidase [Deltaproteobacteria bacterium]